MAFTPETALKNIQAAEDAWNSRDPKRIALADLIDCEWPNRIEFLKVRDEIKASSTAGGPRNSTRN